VIANSQDKPTKAARFNQPEPLKLLCLQSEHWRNSRGRSDAGDVSLSVLRLVLQASGIMFQYRFRRCHFAAMKALLLDAAVYPFSRLAPAQARAFLHRAP